MLSPYVYVPLVVVPIAAVLLVAAKRSMSYVLSPQSHRAHAIHTHALHVPAYLRIWAVIVLFSALEAVILRLAGRSVFGQLLHRARPAAARRVLFKEPPGRSAPAPLRARRVRHVPPRRVLAVLHRLCVMIMMSTVSNAFPPLMHFANTRIRSGRWYTPSLSGTKPFGKMKLRSSRFGTSSFRRFEAAVTKPPAAAAVCFYMRLPATWTDPPRG
jgi:hypothetical protein